MKAATFTCITFSARSSALKSFPVKVKKDDDSNPNKAGAHHSPHLKQSPGAVVLKVCDLRHMP